MKLHRILSPPRGRRMICSIFFFLLFFLVNSLDLPLCVFLSSVSPLRFIPHLETKTDTTCGADDPPVFDVHYSLYKVQLSFSEHALFGFIGLSCKVNLILQYVFISQHIPWRNSAYNNAPVIVPLKFSPYGYYLCLVWFFTLQ